MFKNSQESSSIFKNFHEFSRIFKNFQEFSRNFEKFQAFSRISKNFQEFPRIPKDFQEKRRPPHSPPHPTPSAPSAPIFSFFRRLRRRFFIWGAFGAPFFIFHLPPSFTAPSAPFCLDASFSPRPSPSPLLIRQLPSYLKHRPSMDFHWPANDNE